MLKLMPPLMVSSTFLAVVEVFISEGMNVLDVVGKRISALIGK
jgi:hypothetical protein